MSSSGWVGLDRLQQRDVVERTLHEHGRHPTQGPGMGQVQEIPTLAGPRAVVWVVDADRRHPGCGIGRGHGDHGLLGHRDPVAVDGHRGAAGGTRPGARPSGNRSNDGRDGGSPPVGMVHSSSRKSVTRTWPVTVFVPGDEGEACARPHGPGGRPRRPPRPWRRPARRTAADCEPRTRSRRRSPRTASTGSTAPRKLSSRASTEHGQGGIDAARRTLRIRGSGSGRWWWSVPVARWRRSGAPVPNGRPARWRGCRAGCARRPGVGRPLLAIRTRSPVVTSKTRTTSPPRAGIEAGSMPTGNWKKIGDTGEKPSLSAKASSMRRRGRADRSGRDRGGPLGWHHPDARRGSRVGVLPGLRGERQHAVLNDAPHGASASTWSWDGWLGGSGAHAATTDHRTATVATRCL